MDLNTPDTDSLSALAREVAFELFSCTFEVASAPQGQAPQVGREIVLSGVPGVVLQLACNTQAQEGLLACSDPDQAAFNAKLPADDALGEWLNVMAGQLKTQQAWSHEIGLPKPANLSSTRPAREVWFTNAHSHACIRLTWSALDAS